MDVLKLLTIGSLLVTIGAQVVLLFILRRGDQRAESLLRQVREVKRLYMGDDGK